MHIILIVSRDFHDFCDCIFMLNSLRQTLGTISRLARNVQLLYWIQIKKHFQAYLRHVIRSVVFSTFARFLKGALYKNMSILTYTHEYHGLSSCCLYI